MKEGEIKLNETAKEAIEKLALDFYQRLANGV